jgi:hypothetical protein
VLELIKVSSAVAVPTSDGGLPVRSSFVAALNIELGAFGYTMDKSLWNQISLLSHAQAASLAEGLRNAMCELTGSDRSGTNRTLFRHFPYDTPYSAEYANKRRSAWLMHEWGFKPNDDSYYTLLSCGHYIDNRVFDLNMYGACPICEQQVPELTGDADPARYTFQNITPLKFLTTFDAAKAVSGLLARMGSWTPDEKAVVVANMNIDLNQIERPAKVYRENLPIVATMYRNDTDYVASLMSGATDVLRLATFMSSPTADLSLSENTRFKLNTPEKRRVLKLMEAMPNLAEDMMRHRERWLRLGEQLGVNSKKNRERFPKTQKAFKDLREAPSLIETYSRTVDQKVRNRIIDARLIEALKSRPGEFLRRLDFLLRTPTTYPIDESVTFGLKTIKIDDGVLTALREVGEKAPLRLLFDVYKYLLFRASPTFQDRMFIPKGTSTKVKVMPDNRPSIPADRLATATEIISAAITARFVSMTQGVPKMNFVAAPELSKSLLPFNARGASSTNIPLNKGSHYPINKSMAFVRLFLHWKHHTDVDLSAIGMDSNFHQIEQISFTNLSGSGAIHSGDLRNAARGGSEFIDIDIARFRSRGIRYVAMSVISYGGVQFKEIDDCFAGYMERDALKSGKLYEPKSVALKFELNAASTSHNPLILDLVEMELIYADMSTGNGAFGAVARDEAKHRTLTAAIMTLPSRKVTVGDVLGFYFDALRDESLPLHEVGSEEFSLAAVMALLQ